nr:MAG TPA: hypothetical protein [Caudoviricetes sp.]
MVALVAIRAAILYIYAVVYNTNLNYSCPRYLFTSNKFLAFPYSPIYNLLTGHCHG